MSRGLIFSFLFHTEVIFITALTLPFMMREPIDVPPIVSVELIQIKDKTFIGDRNNLTKKLGLCNDAYKIHLKNCLT